MKYNVEAITEIREIPSDEEGYVYDLEVDDTHNFFANDILVHNSSHFSFKPLMSDYLTEDRKISPDAYKLCENIGDYLNTVIVEWAKRTLFSTDPRFYFKREAICDAGIYLKKKRYIFHILDLEGFPVDKFKYVGVQVARSTMSAEVKSFIKSVIENLMINKDRTSANKIFKQAYEDFQKLSVVDVSFRSKISDYAKYSSKMEDEYSIPTGTPLHVKSAMFYNRLLKKYGLTNSFEPIGSGQKIKYYYAGKNCLGVTSMAFIETLPDEIRSAIPINYQLMFEKTVVPPLKSVYEAINWTLPDLIHEQQTDLFALFG